MRTEQEQIKHDKIIVGLERGLEKKKETMVLSALLFDIDLFDLEPEFQKKLLKENNTSHYYYDIFYPNLNTIIEVDEEHHETSTKYDQEKEEWAVKQWECSFYRIKLHKKYGTVQNQIQEIKQKLIQNKTLLNEGFKPWVENVLDLESEILKVKKTIVVRMGQKRKDLNFNNFPIQINEVITKETDITVHFLTGGTATMAQSFTVQPKDWEGHGTGSLFVKANPNPNHDWLQSGSTFHNTTNNIVLSPDLKELSKK